MTFLIVDDSKAIRFLLRQALEQLGHTILAEAKNGMEAIAHFKSFTPEVVTLDLVMPGENGLNVLKEIKKISPNANVILITSAATVEVQKEAAKEGALAILHKPFTQKTIEQALKVLKPGKVA